MVKLNFLFSTLVLFLIAISSTVQAQTQFDLKEKDNHYYFDAKINGTEVRNIMVETGAHGFAMRESEFNKLFPTHKFKLVDRKTRKIGLLGKIYDIVHLYGGSFLIGDMKYSGFIYVLPDAMPEKCYVNMQNLTNTLDSTKNVLKFNFPKRQMAFVHCEAKDTASLHHFDLSRMHPWLITSAKVTVQQAKKRYDLRGNFVIDFGNPRTMDFFSNATIQKFCEATGIRKTDAYGYGEKNLQCIKFDQIIINGKRIGKYNPAIRTIRNESLAGLIGLTFFDGDVFLDTQRGKMYYE